MMADRLREKRYHPVMLFGTTSSGKSTLLASLLAYIRADNNSNVSIGLGEWIVRPNSPYGESQFKDAQAFFHRTVVEFQNGKAPVQTRSEFPFYIPVTFKPGNGLPDMKFAFLESRGEWYKPKRETDAYYEPFHHEISDVLNYYPAGLSIIYVAPYTTLDGPPAFHDDEDDLHDSDEGLYGAMKSYEETRNSPQRDQHLYLLSKWDRYARPNGPDNKFSHPDRQEMESLLDEKFNQSWPAYQNMALRQPAGRRSFMQYCAGQFSGQEIRRIDEDLKPIMYRYPRTVWNWLYGSAMAINGNPGLTLYRDVLPPPPPPKPSLWDRILK
jgi:hypothetical protein